MSRSDQAFIQGDDPALGLTVTSGGAPLNLTGKRVELQVRESEFGPEIYTLSSVDGAPPKITITDAAAGTATADLTNLLTDTGTFWYQAWVADVTDPELDKQTFAYGNWFVGFSATGGSCLGGPCQPWATSLPESCAAELDNCYDDSTVLCIATSTLWRLSGRRYGLCDRTVRPCMEECWETRWDNGPYLSPLWGVYGNGTWWPHRAACGSCGDSCSCSRVCEINLLGPVQSITAVTVDGVTLDSTAYRVDDRRKLVRVDGDCWPRCQDFSAAIGEDNTFSVQYVRGVTPPPDAVRAVTDLAFELAKAECGNGACRLPTRLTNIVRQGVTASTVIDDLDFLERGRTGLYFVDLFLRSANPKGITRGARVYRADARQPRVTSG